MRTLGSIRAKIWLCALVGLIGYFLATLCSLYTNVTHYRRLSQLETVYVPLSVLSSDILHTFRKQTQQYEDAFLAGEKDLAVQGNLMSNELLEMLDRMRNQVKDADISTVPLDSLDTLSREYKEYTQTAALVYTKAATADFPPDSVEKIQRLGLIQQALLQSFSSLDKSLATLLTKEIENDKTNALRNALFIGILFAFVFLAAALIIDRVASRLLVQPLATIQENVNRFSLSQQASPPPTNTDPEDEIGKLANAFWEMTEQLKTTMVSQRYVDNIIRNISNGLVVTSPTGIIQTVNQRILEMSGYREKDLLGKPLTLLLAQAEQETPFSPVHILDTLATAGPIYDREILCRTKGEKKFPSHFSSAPMHNDQGILQGFVCIFNDITELKCAESRLKQLAHYDPLTGVANRTLFFEQLEQAIDNAKRNDQIFALLYIDLDNFKPINDTLGHDIGDLILKNVAKRLQHNVRADDTVARVGGDEFTVILNPLQHEDDAAMIARKVVGDIAKPFWIKNIMQTLGVSVGISLFPKHGASMEDLLTRADYAMYDAKSRGGNSYHVAQEEAPNSPQQPALCCNRSNITP